MLPSFIILLTIAIFFRSLYDYPQTERVFAGMRPAVVALILYPVFSFSKNITPKEYPIVAAVAVAIYFGLSPVIFIVAAVLWGVIICRRNMKRDNDSRGKGGRDMIYLELFLAFFKIGIFGFGEGMPCCR